MARTKLVVHKMDLKQQIDLAECHQTFDTRQALAEAIADTDWAKNYQPKPITASVVLLRIAEFGIEPKTPKGKRGRAKGTKLSSSQKAAMQAGRGKKRIDKGTIEELRASVPLSLYPLVDRIENGSKVSAIKMKCLECCCFVKSEVRDCEIKTCPLWSIRPYQ